jgi:hypothetical protein
VSEKDSVPPSAPGGRPLLVTAVVAGGVEFALGRARGGGSPLDARPSSGAVLEGQS